MKLEGIYVITDESLVNGRMHNQIAEAALLGGANIIQLRDKSCTDKHFYYEALKIRELTKKYSAIFIINDRVHIAKAVNADGVNCGQGDLSCKVIRDLLGEKAIIGISCSSIEEAIKAETEGANYIGFGPIFPTCTKTGCLKEIGLEMISKVKNTVKIPIASIAGINKDNIHLVAQHGSHMACVVSAVVTSQNMQKTTKELVEICNNHKKL